MCEVTAYFLFTAIGDSTDTHFGLLGDLLGDLQAMAKILAGFARDSLYACVRLPRPEARFASTLETHPVAEARKRDRFTPARSWCGPGSAGILADVLLVVIGRSSSRGLVETSSSSVAHTGPASVLGLVRALALPAASL